MTALPPVPDVVRCRLLFTTQGKLDQGLRFFYQYTGTAPSTANLEAFGATMQTALDSSVKTYCLDDITWTAIIFEDLATDTGSTGETSFSEAGTLDDTAIPSSAAFVTSYEIAKRYRGGHPRSYWPMGGGSLLNTAAEWTDTAVTDLTAAAVTTIDSVIDATEGGTTIATHVAVSYYSGFTPVENPITHRYRNVPTLKDTPDVYAVASIVGRSYVGSMRKRRPKTS